MPLRTPRRPLYEPRCGAAARKPYCAPRAPSVPSRAARAARPSSRAPPCAAGSARGCTSRRNSPSSLISWLWTGGCRPPGTPSGPGTSTASRGSPSPCPGGGTPCPRAAVPPSRRGPPSRTCCPPPCSSWRGPPSPWCPPSRRGAVLLLRAVHLRPRRTYSSRSCSSRSCSTRSCSTRVRAASSTPASSSPLVWRRARVRSRGHRGCGTPCP
mmetsp:Transcript_92466/g.261780  ORF Transcript_92466/g.261780 Transcript_92466/m.261780 type:complete len:212 (+) Transcript_92466:78-713(+)